MKYLENSVASKVNNTAKTVEKHSEALRSHWKQRWNGSAVGRGSELWKFRENFFGGGAESVNKTEKEEESGLTWNTVECV